MPGPGIKVRKPVVATSPAVSTAAVTNKLSVLKDLVDDKAGRRSTTVATAPRPEQDLMNKSLQVAHPFDKGKTVGWGEYKGMAKTQASRFRDMGITDMATHQQKVYDTALKALPKFPEPAVAKYKEARAAESRTTAIAGNPVAPSGRVVNGGMATYAKGTKSIKVAPKKQK